MGHLKFYTPNIIYHYYFVRDVKNTLGVKYVRLFFSLYYNFSTCIFFQPLRVTVLTIYARDEKQPTKTKEGAHRTQRRSKIKSEKEKTVTSKLVMLFCLFSRAVKRTKEERDFEADDARWPYQPGQEDTGGR